jgi:hypothetical protein
MCVLLEFDLNLSSIIQPLLEFLNAPMKIAEVVVVSMI